VGSSNIAAGPAGLRPARPGREASAAFVVACPYAMVDAWLDATALRRTAGDTLAVEARSEGGKWQEIFRANETGRIELEKLSLKRFTWPGRLPGKRYYVRFQMRAADKPADVAIESFKVTTVFMNNMYALPYFLPGKNVIRVTAAPGADLRANRLTLSYAWEEQGKTRSLEKRIDRLPFETTVEVAGEAPPRMKSVALSVAP